jgi:hypothetical protein
MVAALSWHNHYGSARTVSSRSEQLSPGLNCSKHRQVRLEPLSAVYTGLEQFGAV